MPRNRKRRGLTPGERYESNEHDVMASELAAWVKRANALA